MVTAYAEVYRGTTLELKMSLSMHERVERNHKCEASCVLTAVVNASEEKG